MNEEEIEGQGSDNERPETAESAGQGEKPNPDAPGPQPGPGEGLRGVMLDLSSLMGGRPKGVHEIGVQGSVLSATRDMVEEYVKPELGVATIPGTEIEIPVVLSKDGYSIIGPEEFDDWREKPMRRKGTAKLLSLDSFIAHVNRFGDDDTVVFADNNRLKPKLVAVLDYNLRGSTSAPRFGEHRSTFDYPVADEWKAWNEFSGKPMKMVDFARFLDDHIIDVLPGHLVSLDEDATRYMDTLPNRTIADPSRLMDLATGLQINEQSVIREANVLQDGTGVVVFENVHTDARGQKLEIPSVFVLGIPVFRNGPAYQVIARLRYRKTDSGILFWYDLWRTDRVFDHSFNETVERVQAETGSDVLLGFDEGNLSG